MRSLAHNRSEGGFTLIEILVALVITSLLISILMGMLFYVYKVQDALRGEIIDRELELRSHAWFSELLAACVPADLASGANFAGSNKELSCDTLSPLSPQMIPAPQRITLKLRRSKENFNELVYNQQAAVQEQDLVIKTLPDGDALFYYSGIKGSEKDFWPPTVNDPETLPRRIRLVVKDSSRTVFEWMGTPLADPWLEPVIKNPFGLELPR